MPDQVARGDAGVAGWISAELQQNVIQPIADFKNPDQEWRRLFSELLGTFFLGGRIGFWSDDYWHNLRNPTTGALPALTFHGLTMDRGFFLRPLFYLVVPAVTTLSWKAQWPAHVALGHRNADKGTGPVTGLVLLSRVGPHRPG